MSSNFEAHRKSNTNSVDSSSLELLIGYNAKRASSVAMHGLAIKLQKYGLQGPIDYSVLTLIAHNSGITSMQLSHALSLFPANLSGIVKSLEDRGFLSRQQHPTDRRAYRLHLTEIGLEVQADAEAVAIKNDAEFAKILSESERSMLNQFLLKLYAS